MKNMRDKSYYILFCVQCAIYASYILCLNHAHALFPTEASLRLGAFLQWGNRLFSFYVMLSIFVLWQIVRCNVDSLKNVMAMANIYHFILYGMAFILEIVFQYAYFKPMAYAMQAFVLLLMVNIVVLLLYVADKLYSIARNRMVL